MIIKFRKLIYLYAILPLNSVNSKGMKFIYKDRKEEFKFRDNKNYQIIIKNYHGL